MPHPSANSDHTLQWLSAADEQGRRRFHGLQESALEISTRSHLDALQRRSRLLRQAAFILLPSQLRQITSHSEEVARTAVRVGQLMNLAPPRIGAIKLAALMHDLGIAALPADAEITTDFLANERLVNLHARAGAAIATALGLDDETARAIAEIYMPLTSSSPPGQIARIIRVADSIVLATNQSPHSSARAFTECLAELRRGRGTRFDVDVVVAAHMYGASAMALAA